MVFMVNYICLNKCGYFFFSLLPIQGSVIVAVNQEYTDKEQVIHLKSGDEVAIIPPISGG